MKIIPLGIFALHAIHMLFGGTIVLKSVFCSGIQLYIYVLLSSFLCFIFLFYFDLYELGDNASNS